VLTVETDLDQKSDRRLKKSSETKASAEPQTPVVSSMIFQGLWDPLVGFIFLPRRCSPLDNQHREGACVWDVVEF
jgi:hypothetical protein